jgi:hypothetical protein
VTQPVPREQVPAALRAVGGSWAGAKNLWAQPPDGVVVGEPTRLKHGAFTLDKRGRMTAALGPPVLTAQRLDGDGTAHGDRLDDSNYASASGENGRVDFWPSTITLPTPGCWELTQKLGGTTIRFVVLVRVDNPAAEPTR